VAEGAGVRVAVERDDAPVGTRIFDATGRPFGFRYAAVVILKTDSDGSTGIDYTCETNAPRLVSNAWLKIFPRWLANLDKALTAAAVENGRESDGEEIS